MDCLNALDLARLSMAAYLAPERRDAIAAMIGVQVVHAFNGDLTGFVGRYGSTDLILYRGTDSPVDVWDCVRVDPLLWCDGGSIPHGMGAPLEEGWGGIQAHLRAGAAKLVGGHSLGGNWAHATVARWLREAEAVSFGAAHCWNGAGPMPGRHTRFVHDRDIVPGLPPVWRHALPEYHWLRPRETGVEWMLDARPGHNLSPADHSIETYIAAVATTDARLIAF